MQFPVKVGYKQKSFIIHPLHKEMNDGIILYQLHFASDVSKGKRVDWTSRVFLCIELKGIAYTCGFVPAVHFIQRRILEFAYKRGAILQ